MKVLTLKVGRKYPYMCGSITTGVMFLLTLFIERDKYPSNWPIVVLALIGNFSTTLCFAILYMYTGNTLHLTPYILHQEIKCISFPIITDALTA